MLVKALELCWLMGTHRKDPPVCLAGGKKYEMPQPAEGWGASWVGTCELPYH